MPLRVSYQQWNAESCHDYSDEVQCFIPVLKSLRVMEEEILHKFVDSSYMFVESPSFDVLIRLYTNLIEDHKLFWNGVTSSNVEQLLISWRSIMKDAAKFMEVLKDICPEAVDVVLVS
jgi:midasin